MNVYFDLMIVAHIIIVMVSVKFMNTVSTNRLKGRGIFKLTITTIPLFVGIYFPTWIAVILIILLHILIFFLFFKKYFFSPLIYYLSCYYGLCYAMSLITTKVSVYHFVFVIHSPYGLLSLMVLPIFLLILYLVVRGVDCLYHLGNYKMDVILTVNDQKARFRSYYDTGNTVKYHGVPVIFCLRKNWPFMLNDDEKYISYEMIKEKSKVSLQEALISMNDLSEKTLVYVALIDRKEGFNGCECLLNAYLH